MLTLVAAAVAGVLVGLLSGLLGIGGGTIMVPLFRLAFGLPAIQATATSLLAIIPTSLSGCVGHFCNRTCVIGVGLAAGLAGACTSPAGVHLASISPSWAIMLTAAVIIGYSAFTMLKKGLAMPKETGRSKASAATAKAGAKATVPAERPARVRATRRQTVVGVAAGAVAGLASGYVGVGGGFLMVPLFIQFGGISMRQASGTSLIAVTLLAIPGAIAQIMLGNVHILAGLVLSLGSIPGALVGANLVRYVPERTLRLLFGGFLLVVAVILVGNEIMVPEV
ncbi:sulfite exporter TauE/SafE family protein [Hugonella massiliensis]|uniref:sulfite exporter TauE/SafE family protein n=1 Tax=Hugonella massiliensis TaxID=1720315 RepID=UPI00073F9BEA|nr:sulfite exporter TauE/SafE family protein [Hugonella massiliensis]